MLTVAHTGYAIRSLLMLDDAASSARPPPRVPWLIQRGSRREANRRLVRVELLVSIIWSTQICFMSFHLGTLSWRPQLPFALGLVSTPP